MLAVSIFINVIFILYYSRAQVTITPDSNDASITVSLSSDSRGLNEITSANVWYITQPTGNHYMIGH